MMFSLIFFLFSFFSGLAIVSFFKTTQLFKIPTAFLIGLIINILLILFSSLFWGLNIVNITIINLGLFLISLAVLIKNFKKEDLIPKIDRPKNLLAIFGLGFLSAIIVLIFIKSIDVNQNSVIAGNRLVWVDWPVHIAIISSFVHGHNFPPQNPLYSGQLIAYPFLVDFLSSILLKIGATLKTSLVLPGIVLGLTSLFMIYCFGKIITKDNNLTIVGLLIGLFWGGLGFLYFIGDLASTNFWETLLFPPREYTFYQAKNLWFFSFLYSELLPQRAFLLGLPIFFASLILLIKGLAINKKPHLLVAGSLIAIMPFFHMHSYLAILIFCAIFIPLTIISILKTEGLAKAKRLAINIFIYFLLPIIGLGLIQLPIFLAINLKQTLGINLGWLKGQENFFVFWFKNTGLFWPLLILAIAKTKLDYLVRNILIASTALFILPNLLRFAPWPYDNLKIMTYWYLIDAFFVAMALSYLFKKGFLVKIVAILICVSLILSGMIEVWRIFNTQRTSITLWTQDDFQLADAIIKKTEPNSVILTAAVHDHPVTALAGRKIIIGFPGNAWSWGLADWSQRESDVRTMLRGDPRLTIPLLAKYKVDYVLISSREKYFEPQLNENYYSQNFALIDAEKNYQLYKVR